MISLVFVLFLVSQSCPEKMQLNIQTKTQVDFLYRFMEVLHCTIPFLPVTCLLHFSYLTNLKLHSFNLLSTVTVPCSAQALTSCTISRKCLGREPKQSWSSKISQKSQFCAACCITSEASYQIYFAKHYRYLCQENLNLFNTSYPIMINSGSIYYQCFYRQFSFIIL